MRKSKRWLAAGLAASLILTGAVVQPDSVGRLATVYATTAQQLKEQAEKDLENKKEEIEKIQGNQQEVANSLNDAGEKLDALLDKQKELREKINETQKKVEQASADLNEARETEAEEYQAMKLRIQFMYENSAEQSIWSAILDSNGITDMLNRIDYITDMYKSDRKLLLSYQDAVERVEELMHQLNEEMNGLMELQEDYESQQARIEEMISSLEDQKEKYAKQLSRAKEQVKEYEKTIEEQGRIIQQQEAEAARRAEEERRKREEAERKRREEEARRKAEQERLEQERLEQERQNQQSQSSSSSSSTTDEFDDYDGGGSGESGLGDDKTLTDPSANPTPMTGVSGSEVVAYAMQFVGNPYVWGGNSLTNGVDCSGFVHQIYKHFGISTPRYSQSFKKSGQAVSLDNIQPGDVVVYPGHVAIYAGNGKIVEAQSRRAGITNTRSVTCHTIYAIRRLV